MKVERFICKYLSANCYLVSEGDHAFIIDPCCSDALADAIERQHLTVDFALLTHEHADHISGVSWAQDTFAAPVVCSEACGAFLGDVRMNYSLYFETTKYLMGGLGQDEHVTMEPFICHADKTFAGDNFFDWREHTIFCKMTPGHSKGGVCYVMDGCTLFAGDSIFESQDTVTRFKGGSTKEYQAVTVPWLNSLPAETMVYPGHFAPFVLKSWIGRERTET